MHPDLNADTVGDGIRVAVIVVGGIRPAVIAEGGTAEAGAVVRDGGEGRVGRGAGR